MHLDGGLLERTLQALGDVLSQRGLAYEVVAAGGSGLLLLGLIQRPTRDLDLIALVEHGRYVAARPLPEALTEAARDVGELFGLPPDWLNSGPTDLLQFGLPEGFRERVTTRRYGRLVVHLASRFDQVCFKLYAGVDQGPRSKHVADLRRLEPTPAELWRAARWARTHDPSEAFRQEMLALLRSFGTGANDNGEHL